MSRRRGWQWGSVVGLLMTSAAWASMGAPFPDQMRPWSEVLEIQQRAETARVAPYDSMMGQWFLAPEGRFAAVNPASERNASGSAMLGRYTMNGAWLELRFEAASIDMDSLTPEQREQYEAWQEAAQVEQAAAEGEEAAAEALAEASALSAEEREAQAAAEQAMEEASRQRLLRVPYRGGELLVPDSAVTMAANYWKGEGPLKLMAMAWRIPGWQRDPDDYTFEFSIDDPMNANLPHELARLLRPEAIEARVTEVKESLQELVWRHQSAEVHLRLDRGERHGLYPEMNVYGLPPDDDVYGSIAEVHPDYAIAKIRLERFSPRDAVTLPNVGLRFTTRSAKSGACSLDYSAAVRATVLTAAPGELDWDEEGFAFFEASLDQGRAHGLSVGDTLYAEDDEIDGEGRVIRAESERSVVLWRLMRYSESQEITPPRRESKLVTPAWRRAERDVFGDIPALKEAAISE